MIMEDNIRTLVDKAYKKLKGSVFFDKTQLPLLHKLVCFEKNEVSQAFDQMAQHLEDDNDADWHAYEAAILGQIDALVYPKKLKSWIDDSNKSDEKDRIIFNKDEDPVRMEKAQYFIDLPVEGHILGTLWVLKIGSLLDNPGETSSSSTTMYEHSYGNRLRKSLFKSGELEITYSPYLFEPYFSQYESWRDKALAYAKQRLDDKQDALILTMDLQSFYYSIHISKNNYDSILKSAGDHPVWVSRLHEFVYHVLEGYSKKVKQLNSDSKLKLGKRVFLPIGFLPSNILSNWVLTPFDEAICHRINPVYYGRYVDDIIIVDKVEKNSELYKKAQGKKENNSKLTTHDVIAHYFCSCLSETGSDCSCKNALFEFESQPYRINTSVLDKNSTDNVHSDIQIQNDKVKVFYFRGGATRALLDCFRTQIGQNASEFRALPDLDRVFYKNDFSEIFKLQNNETPHKLRGVSAVDLDRFALSKFLGKYRKTSSMIRDNKEHAFEQDLLTILDKKVLIENYTLWERILEIAIVNSHLDYYEKLAINMLNAIHDYQVPDNISSLRYACTSLLYTWIAAVCRTSALCWGQKMKTMLKRMQTAAQSLFPEHEDLFLSMSQLKKAYCQSRMVNKYVLPLPIGLLNFSRIANAKDELINLCHLESFAKYADWKMEEKYIYYPYMVTPQEIAYSLACQDIAEGKLLHDAKSQWDNIEERYLKQNYDTSSNHDESTFGEVKARPLDGCSQTPALIDKKWMCSVISVSSPACKKFKIAIGNARLYEKDFQQALKRNPNRSYARYRQLSLLIKEAIQAKVDMLVLPESYLPWEWVPDVSRLCANSQIALVTGIEHIISPAKEPNRNQLKVYNLTAVILPYCKDEYKFAHVVYHQKVHFSPDELRKIKGYRLSPFEGQEYQLFQWRDLWFSVYCCYELASIAERSLFQSYVDLTVAVEWNKDVPYFSSIMDSLCRDLHCYCVQANSSDYGDSRVMSPSKTVLRDIIKTKGGTNYTILADEINIDALRDYQRKEYELQRDDETFKPTPPNFKPTIAEHKQNHTLLEHILNGEE